MASLLGYVLHSIGKKLCKKYTKYPFSRVISFLT